MLPGCRLGLNPASCKEAVGPLGWRALVNELVDLRPGALLPVLFERFAEGGVPSYAKGVVLQVN